MGQQISLVDLANDVVNELRLLIANLHKLKSYYFNRDNFEKFYEYKSYAEYFERSTLLKIVNIIQNMDTLGHTEVLFEYKNIFDIEADDTLMFDMKLGTSGLIVDDPIPETDEEKLFLNQENKRKLIIHATLNLAFGLRLDIQKLLKAGDDEIGWKPLYNAIDEFEREKNPME